jgi:hypothetical protein
MGGRCCASEFVCTQEKSKEQQMGKKIAVGILGLVLSLVLGLVAMAQDSSVKGNLGGVVVDSTGAVIPGAKVTLSGPTGTQTINSENDGNFLFSRLAPGTYSLKVEKQGFKAADAKGVQVEVGRTANIKMQLQPGAATETVEVSAEAVTVDTASTASGSNLSDTFYSKVPTPRNVSGLFYVAPGVADSGGSGRANPSISGGSGLENLYIADGVNITDAAFGGLGVFTRNQGSVGSGINLSFIKEVQVKTGGFEPQYGQATGGVVQIVTKSGYNFGAMAVTEIVLTAIFPRNDNPAVVPTINRINDAIAKFCDGKRVRYLNVNDKLADADGKLFDGMMNSDKLHPAVKGYQVWADGLKPFFTELLGQPATTDHAPPPTGDPSAAGKANTPRQ